MSKLKVGDYVELTKDQDTYGKKGMRGFIRGIGNQISSCYSVEIDGFIDGHSCCIGLGIRGYSIDLDAVKLVKKGKKGKEKPENLTKYMAYGTGCSNKSNLLETEKELKDLVQRRVKDNDWTGRIIGYKLVPLFEGEMVTKLKVFKVAKTKKVK